MDAESDDRSSSSPSPDHPSSSSPQSLCLVFQQHQQQQQEMTQYTSHGGALLVEGGGAMISDIGTGASEGSSFMFPPEAACGVVPPSPWALPLNPPVHFSTATTTTTTSTTTTSNNVMISSNNPLPIGVDVHDRRMLASLLPQPPLPPYADFHARRSPVPYGYEALLLPSEYSFGLYMGGSGCVPSTSMSTPFGSLQSEFSKMTAQEIMDAKAVAASKSHSEAERRRRERINGHLAKLRSLLPNTTKTDKASLLAEVIEHVKELKRQTSEIVEESGPVPTESDELSVDVVDDEAGRLVVRASLCCDDKPDLLPELIKALKAMDMRTLKAEIVTLGGRVRNVLVIAGENRDGGAEQQHSLGSIQEALKSVMEKATGAASDTADPLAGPSSSAGGGAAISGGTKRQRTTSLPSILENRSI